MKIGALQIGSVRGNKEENLLNVEKYLKSKEIDLLVLPELFSTGYFIEEEERIRLAEKVPVGTTTQKLIELSIKYSVYIVGAIIEKENENLYITAVVTGPEGYIGKHRKRNLTSSELKIYTRGEDSLVFDVKGIKVGVIICFEGWFPESVRALTKQGAQIIAHTALISSSKTYGIMKTRAIENDSYIVIANSPDYEEFGKEKIEFRGESQIIDNNGDILIKGNKTEGIIYTEILEFPSSYKKLPDSDNLLDEIFIYRED
jgi:predicted amidohydrolase